MHRYHHGERHRDGKSQTHISHSWCLWYCAEEKMSSNNVGYICLTLDIMKSTIMTVFSLISEYKIQTWLKYLFQPWHLNISLKHICNNNAFTDWLVQPASLTWCMCINCMCAYILQIHAPMHPGTIFIQWFSPDNSGKHHHLQRHHEYQYFVFVVLPPHQRYNQRHDHSTGKLHDTQSSLSEKKKFYKKVPQNIPSQL